MDTIEDRAAAIFAETAERIEADCDALHSEHSAKGLLRSGATVKRAVRIFHTRSAEGLRQILHEVAQKIEGRGSTWTAAMVKVEAALEAHVADAAGYLKPSFKLAGAGDNAAGRSANALLDKCRADLRRELEAYKKGWTAPKPKRWDELNPTAYAIALLIVGALITALIAVVTGTSG